MQSLILGAVLFIAAMLLGALGVIGDLLAAQRTLSQRTFERVRRIELALGDRALALRAGRAAATDEQADGRPSGRDGRGMRHDVGRRRSRPATRTTSTARPTRSCGG